MNWQAFATVVLVVSSFAAGYGTSSALADAEKAELQKSEAVARADQGRRDYGKLVAAMDRAASLDGELADARTAADRVRLSFERRLRRAEALADDDGEAELTRCTGLLRESVDLLSEGRSMALRSAARADALAELR